MIPNTEEPMTEELSTTLSKNGKKLWPQYGKLAQQISRKLNQPNVSHAIACVGMTRGEGASTVAANLAIAFSITNEQPVLLINGNERPSIAHRALGAQPKTGLEQVVVETVEWPDVISPTLIRNLDYLGCGLKNRETFSPFLVSRFPALLETLKAQYPMVVIDLPALDRPSSSSALMNVADGVVLVMQPGHVKAGKAKRLRQSLERSGAQLLGVVMNRHEEN
jgi:Mrp family chromosome partitioning ATPase